MYGPYNVRDMDRERVYRWCTCGNSTKQPFCDGQSHKGTGFKPLKFRANPSTLNQLCGCKYTQAPPFCDGTHTMLPAKPKCGPCKCKYDW
jgi:CDGSH iron-sulfur domain-containing protein 3